MADSSVIIDVGLGLKKLASDMKSVLSKTKTFSKSWADTLVSSSQSSGGAVEQLTQKYARQTEAIAKQEAQIQKLEDRRSAQMAKSESDIAKQEALVEQLSDKLKSLGEDESYSKEYFDTEVQLKNIENRLNSIRAESREAFRVGDEGKINKLANEYDDLLEKSEEYRQKLEQIKSTPLESPKAKETQSKLDAATSKLDQLRQTAVTAGAEMDSSLGLAADKLTRLENEAEVTAQKLEAIDASPFAATIAEIQADNDKITRGIQEQQNEYKVLLGIYDQAEAALKSAQKSGDRAAESLAQSNMDKLASDIKRVDANIDSLSYDAIKLSEYFKQVTLNPKNADEAAGMKAEISALTFMLNDTSEAANNLNSEFHNAFDEEGANRFKLALTGVQSTISKIAKTGISTFGKILASLKGVGKQANGATGAIDKFGKRIFRLASAALIFNVIRRGFTSLRKHIYSVMQTNDQFISSLSQIKGNLLTAFQPIYEAILPALNALMAALSRITAYIAAFTSMLFGKSVKASQDSAKALYGQAKALDAVGSSAKKASQNMASFDTAEVLGKDDAGGGGGEIAPVFDTDIGEETISIFDRMLDSLAPLRESLEGLWGELQRFGSFAWDGLKDFYELFLRPVGSWVLGEGLPAFVDILTKMLSEIDWSIINGALRELWSALAPFAIQIGKGLLWFTDNVLRPLGVWAANTLVPMIIGLLASAVNVLSSAAGAASPILIKLWEKFFKPMGAWAGEKVADAILFLRTQLDKLSQWLDDNKELFQRFADAVGELTDRIWKLIEPMLDSAWEFLKDIVGKLVDGFLMLIEKVIEFATALIENLVALYDWLDAIGAIEFLTSLLGLAWDSVKAIIGTAIDAILLAVGGLLEGFTGLLNFFTQIFQGDMEGALDSLGLAFKSFGNTVLGFMATVGNGIIGIFERAINWVVDNLNKISFDIPDWVPGIGGKSFGVNIPRVEIDRIPIPALATGAVIPPNREFLAMLGDQRSGRNIEAPEGLIRQIVREEAGSLLSSLGSGPTQPIILQVDGREFARIIGPYAQGEGNRRGPMLVEGASFA